MNYAVFAILYLGGAVLVSLFVPVRLGRSDALRDAPTGIRVLIGLLWLPLAIVWLVALILGVGDEEP